MKNEDDKDIKKVIEYCNNEIMKILPEFVSTRT